MTKEELEQILNNCLNSAMIRNHRLKQPTNSNEIAEFISKWLVKNNDVLPLVSVSLLEEAGKLVGNPGTNISGSCDIACMEWQEKYERWRNER